MLGILFMYLVGREYYKLALFYQKGGWPYALAGVAAYYGGLLLGGLLVAIAYAMFTEESIEDISESSISLMAFPFGVISCVALYQYFKISWKKSAAKPNNEILDELVGDD